MSHRLLIVLDAGVLVSVVLGVLFRRKTSSEGVVGFFFRTRQSILRRGFSASVEFGSAFVG